MGYLRSHACLVLHRHIVDIVRSAFSVHVDVEMERRLPTSKPIPSYQPYLVGLSSHDQVSSNELS